jgi:hypothetical protein
MAFAVTRVLRAPKSGERPALLVFARARYLANHHYVRRSVGCSQVALDRLRFSDGPPEIEERLRGLITAIPALGRAEILRVLKIRDDVQRAREIGSLYRSGVLPVTSEVLIDAEEDPALRAVLVGMIQEIQT